VLAKRFETFRLMLLWVSIGLPYVIAVNHIDDLVIQLVLTGLYLVAVLSVVRLVHRRRG